MLTDKFGDLVILVVVFVIPFFLFFILEWELLTWSLYLYQEENTPYNRVCLAQFAPGESIWLLTN